MKLIASAVENIPEIIKIIDDAKEYLASQKIDQWQNGYPNADQIANDIKNNQSFVVIDDAKNVVATTMFTTNSEPTYKNIEGKWLLDESKKYGVVHRLAIKKEHRKKGIAVFILDELHQQLKHQKIKSLKIDTHEKNINMQKLLKKMGHQYCGIIYTNYQAKRWAFEKIID